MIRLTQHKFAMCDIDDTLVMQDRSIYPEAERRVINVYGHDVEIVINQRLVNRIDYYGKLGWSFIFWSRTGEKWAYAVAKELDLLKYAVATMSKPLVYFDDRPADEWMERLWRDV